MGDIHKLLEKIAKSGKNKSKSISLKDGFQFHRALLAHISGDEETLDAVANAYTNTHDQIIKNKQTDLLH